MDDLRNAAGRNREMISTFAVTALSPSRLGGGAGGRGTDAVGGAIVEEESLGGGRRPRSAASAVRRLRGSLEPGREKRASAFLQSRGGPRPGE